MTISQTVISPHEMPFQYKKILVVGATGGIGKALADRLVLEGSHVIAVGRRQQHLNDFVAQHGKSKVSSVAFDIANLDKIPQFAKRYVLLTTMPL